MSRLDSSQAKQKLSRLAEMRPREIAHRVRERLYWNLERIGVGGSAGLFSERESFKAYLANAAERFYFNHPEQLAEFVRENRPDWIGRANLESEQLCRRRIELLGYGPVELGPEIDWHRDPITGRTWERRFWADYKLPQDCSGGDPKTIHELNRHQHLPRLAKAFLLTGKERYASEAVAQMESWIEQNPPGLGINWQSSLEIGIRAISWMWTLFLLLPSRSLDEGSARRIGQSLFAQLEHVHRYPSTFSSPNTHLIGEAAALFVAGLIFCDRGPARSWLEKGRALLIDTVEKQVLNDGVYGELSSYYHCYALDFYLQALILGERNGLPFPDTFRHKICAMTEFLMHLTRPDGTIPLLGDDDGGRALALARRNYRSFSDALCLGAILFMRGDFKHQSGAFAEEALWLLGRHSRDIYGQLDSEPPAETSRFHRDGGYLTQRSDWGPDADHLVFDCGGLGMLAGGHAHADALSLIFFSRGRELLVDPGTFVYNGAPEWRSHFRSTRAHNTVSMDGRDQVEPDGTFRWKGTLCSRVVEHLNLADIDYTETECVEHSQTPELIHRRRLLHVKSQYWLVVDDFRGAGGHTFDFFYHFAPGVEISELEPDELVLMAHAREAGLLLGLFASQPVGREFVCGQMEPIGGWASSGYGEKKPIQSLRATVAASVPAAAMTFLVPRHMAAANNSRGPVVRRMKVEDGSAVACSYEHRDVQHIAVFSTADAEVTVADFRMQGNFFWLHMAGGVLQQVLAIRARSLSCGGRDIFRRSEPGLYSGAVNSGWEQSTLCAQYAGLLTSSTLTR